MVAAAGTAGAGLHLPGRFCGGREFRKDLQVEAVCHRRTSPAARPINTSHRPKTRFASLHRISARALHRTAHHVTPPHVGVTPPEHHHACRVKPCRRTGVGGETAPTVPGSRGCVLVLVAPGGRRVSQYISGGLLRRIGGFGRQYRRGSRCATRLWSLLELRDCNAYVM